MQRAELFFNADDDSDIRPYSGPRVTDMSAASPHGIHPQATDAGLFHSYSRRAIRFAPDRFLSCLKLVMLNSQEFVLSGSLALGFRRQLDYKTRSPVLKTTE